MKRLIMHKTRSLKLSLALAFFCSAAMLSAAPAESAGREKAAFEEKEQLADSLSEQANKYALEAAAHYKDSKYKEAIDSYLEAIRILKELSARNPKKYQRKLEYCKETISKCYFYWAQELYFDSLKLADAKKYEEAIQNCLKAEEMWPACKPQMDTVIEKLRKSQEAETVLKKLSRKNVMPGEEDRIYSEEVLLRQGDALYADGQWDRARDKYEEVLASDPYNVRAIESIRKTNIQLLRAGARRTDTSRNEYVSEVKWKMVSPLRAKVAGESVSTSTSRQETIIKSQTEAPLEKKLRTIRIPSISFEDASISDVLKHLRERSRQLDPEKQGINIFYLRASAADEAAKKPSEEGAPAGAPPQMPGPEAASQPQAAAKTDNAGANAAGEDEPPIFLTMNNASLLEIITAICKTANLRHRIDKHTVVIADPKVQLEELETRLYPLEKEAVERIKDSGGSGGGGGGAAAGGGLGGEGEAVSSGPASRAKKFFMDAGIEFGPGANAIYNDFCRRLIITNTRDNLDKMETLIRDLNVVDPQVLIQTKFVEVHLNDIEELGFAYSLSRDQAPKYADIVDTEHLLQPSNNGVYPQLINQGGNFAFYNAPTNATAGYAVYYGTTDNYSSIVTVNNNTNIPVFYMRPTLGNSSAYWSPNSQSLVRSASSLPEQSGVTDGLYNFQYTNSDYGVRLNSTIRAIDQADSTDVLACPRITTLNGYDASISMVTEKYFPTDWEDADFGTIATAGGGSVPLFTPSIPELDEATRLGIELKVHPLVNMSNGVPDTINLHMNPVISSHVGWTDYSYSLTVGVGNNQTETYQNILKMPIFEVRSVDTSVNCYDGETIVLGGIIKDQVNAIDDQYPILGDIPLVGRLFQSKAKTSKKTNLLIFLTCRLINPDGTPIREREMRGLPPFRQ